MARPVELTAVRADKIAQRLEGMIDKADNVRKRLGVAGKCW